MTALSSLRRNHRWCRRDSTRVPLTLADPQSRWNARRSREPRTPSIPLWSARGWCVSLRSTCTRTSHTLGAQAQPPRCAQVKLKEQAKERQQVELTELKRVAAQQEVAWVKFEQERQAKAEVENAAKAASRAEASAKRRLAMMSGREPKGDAPADNLKKLMDGKGSKKQKAGAKGKGGSARSKCLRSQQPSGYPRPGARPRAQGYPLGPRGEPSAFGCRRGAVVELQRLPTPAPA